MGPGPATLRPIARAVKTLRNRNIARALLLLVLLSAAVAVTWSYLGRQGEEAAASEHEVLDEDVARRSLDFQHSEFRGGNLQFQVRAASDTLTAEGEHRLQQVELLLYDETGAPSDSVRGRVALYRVDSREIEFQDEVQIRLADSTRIFSDRIRADLHASRIEVPQDFDFERGSVKGSGGALIYLTGARRMTVEGGFRLELPSETGTATASSRRALYDLAAGELDLEGTVRVAHPGYRLGSQELDVRLDSEQRVKFLTARGAAQLEVLPRRRFGGDRIDFRFDAKEGGLSEFEVFGGASRPASFREANPGGERTVQAQRLRVLPASSPGGQSLHLSRFLAQGRVSLRSAGGRLQGFESQNLEADFDDADRLRGLLLDGEVRATGAQGEQLRGRRVAVALDESEQPRTIRVEGDVQLQVPFPDGPRTLATPHRLELDFERGVLERAACPRQCRLDSRQGEERTELRSDSLRADLQGGQAREVIAAGNVRLEQAGAEGLVSTSRELRLHYRDGLLVDARQRGDVRLRQGGDTPVVLSAEEAVLDPATQLVTAEGGSPRLVQPGEPGRELVTRAGRFQLHRVSGDLSASGGVRTELQRQDQPVVVTARFMQAERGGWVEYTGDPELREGESLTRARVIRLHPEQDLLTARQDVDSRVRIETAEGLRIYRVRAEQMQLERAQSTLFYQGGVDARSEELNLQSEQLRLDFEDPALAEVREVTAWGGVVVQDSERTARGERCRYFPDEGKVQVFGSPATVVDSRQGKATGAVLTFFTGDDRLRVDSSQAGGRP